jgi:hypothetical protein
MILCYKPAILGTLLMLLTAAVPPLVIVSAEKPHARQLQEIPQGVTQCDLNESSQQAFGTLKQYTANDPMPFCANHAVCRSDYVDHPEAPCVCPRGYGGQHCEFLLADMPKCVLPCRNNGVCMLGVIEWEELISTDSSNVEDLGTITATTSNEADSFSSMQYCSCLDGFNGPLCELKNLPCGDGYCYNGGTCVEVSAVALDTARAAATNQTAIISSKSFHCDCTTAGDETTIAYAGESCEFPLTTLCSEGLDTNGRHFCVNGGTCKGES